MDSSVPTVTIKDPNKPGDYIIINESDFDPKRHEMFDAPAAEKPEDVDQVEIPANWQGLPWFTLRALAAHFSESPPANKADAVSLIEAEIAKREAAKA